MIESPDHPTGAGKWLRVILIVLLASTALIIPGCTSPTCSAGLHEYHDKCLSNMAIQYVGCTEGRGISPTTEIGGDVGGTFKVVADASLKIAYKKTEQENTPVALQIVKDCMEVARNTSPPDDPEQAAAAQWQKETIAGTPSIKLSRGSARKGQKIVVTGSKFWPEEMVDVNIHASLVAQVKADGQGSFSATVTVPPDAPPANFSTTISATGESSVKTAQAPFHTT